MTDTLRGGKNNKAPYEITHIRVPLPLKEVLKKAIGIYTKAVIQNDSPGATDFRYEVEKFLNGFVSRYGCTYNKNTLITIDDSIELREAVVKNAETIAALEQERDILRENSRSAIALLEGALKLRANHGGVIKQEIKKALLLIDGQDC